MQNEGRNVYGIVTKLLRYEVDKRIKKLNPRFEEHSYINREIVLIVSLIFRFEYNELNKGQCFCIESFVEFQIFDVKFGECIISKTS